MSHHHHQKQVDDFTKRTFFNKYRPLKKLGEGSFGKIYSAVNINNEQKFALKMEYKEAPQNLLESEAYILCYLKGCKLIYIIIISKYRRHSPSKKLWFQW
jgi:serine/threonine protein kinase